MKLKAKLHGSVLLVALSYSVPSRNSQWFSISRFQFLFAAKMQKES